jgi:hypothetical protein
VFCILWYMCSISTLLLAWMNNNGRISIFSFFWDMVALCGACVPIQHGCLQLSLLSITHTFIDVEAFLRFFSWLGWVPYLCHFYPVSAQASKTYSPVSSS